MPRCPSLKGKNGIGGPTVRLSLGRGAGRRAEHGHRTHRNTSPPFLQLGKCRPRAPGGPRGRSARCGNGLFAQCVRLRSEINPNLDFDVSPSTQSNMWGAPKRRPSVKQVVFITHIVNPHRPIYPFRSFLPFYLPASPLPVPSRHIILTAAMVYPSPNSTRS